MYARKNDKMIHFNANIEKTQDFINDGYEILDDDMQVADDPEKATEEEIQAHTMSGTMEDFFKFCKENHVVI